MVQLPLSSLPCGVLPAAPKTIDLPVVVHADVVLNPEARGAWGKTVLPGVLSRSLLFGAVITLIARGVRSV